MKITAIILAHYKERETNLKRMVDDFLVGAVKPNEIIIFIDNPEIKFKDNRATIIRSSRSFLPNIRFALGLVTGADYCFFIDDDLTVRKETLANLQYYATQYPDRILGFEGCLLDDSSEAPYSNAKSFNRGDKYQAVDIVIRTYFVPLKALAHGFVLRHNRPELPKESLDDVFLCMGYGHCAIVPVTELSDLTELTEGGVGQSYTSVHYQNRNIVCNEIRKG
jgi:hypothetical protein